MFSVDYVDDGNGYSGTNKVGIDDNREKAVGKN